MNLQYGRSSRLVIASGARSQRILKRTGRNDKYGGNGVLKTSLQD